MKNKYGIKSKFLATKASSGLMGSAAFVLVGGLGMLAVSFVPVTAGIVAGFAIYGAMVPGGGAALCAVLGGLAACSFAEKYIKPPAALAALGLGVIAGAVTSAAVGGVVGAFELGARSVAAGIKKVLGLGGNKESRKAAASVTAPVHAGQSTFRTTATATTSFTAATTVQAGNDNPTGPQASVTSRLNPTIRN
jgi:hypothetical protein